MANGFGPPGGFGPGPGAPAAPGMSAADLDTLLAGRGYVGQGEVSEIVQAAMAGALSTDDVNQLIAAGTLSQGDIEGLIDAGTLSRDQVQQLIEQNQFDPSQLEGGIESLEDRLAAAEAGQLTGEDVEAQIGQAMEGLPPGMTAEQVQEIAEQATGTGIAGLPAGMTSGEVDEQIQEAMAGMPEGFDPTGLEDRLAALEGAEGFDPTGLQDEIAALQTAQAEDAGEPAFDREQLISDIMNEVYGDMEFAGPTGGDMSGMGPGDPTTAVDVEQIVEDYIANNVETLSDDEESIKLPSPAKRIKIVGL